MLRESIFNALINKNNPFVLIDKNSQITRENLIGRIKSVQNIIVASNTKRVGIITTELTSNTIVTYLAALFLGVEIVFISKDSKAVDIISITTRNGCQVLFADAATIHKLTSKENIINPFTNIININNYQIKHSALFSPISFENHIALDKIVFIRDCETVIESYWTSNYELKHNIKFDTVTISDFYTVPLSENKTVNAFDIHPHVLHFAVLNSILAGSKLKVRTIVENDSIVFVDAYNLVKLCLEEGLNLLPLHEETMMDEIKQYITNLPANFRIRNSLKNKLVLLFNTESVWDLVKRFKLGKLTRKGYRPDRKEKVSFPIWLIDPVLAVELTAKFNLPISHSQYARQDSKNILFVTPVMDAGIDNLNQFQEKTEQFKELFNRKHHTYVTPDGDPITIDQIVLLPA